MFWVRHILLRLALICLPVLGGFLWLVSAARNARSKGCVVDIGLAVIAATALYTAAAVLLLLCETLLLYRKGRRLACRANIALALILALLAFLFLYYA